MHTGDIRTRKAVIIGAGRVGSHVALCLMFQHLVNEIVFVDVNQDAARAQAIDLDDLASGLGDSFTIRVGDYSDCADAHFVILTAGRSRRPGETRLQMLDGTIKVLDGIVGPLKESGFHGILISVSNPADIVVEYLYRKLGLPRNQVFGTGTSLDSARLRRVLSEIIDVSSRQIQAFCMGEHGDSMFIPTSRISVEGIGLREYLSSSPPRASPSRASACASTCPCVTTWSIPSTSTTSCAACASPAPRSSPARVVPSLASPRWWPRS